MRKRGMKPEDLTRLWSTHAAKLAGMQHRKGALAAGMDADIVVRPLPELARPSARLMDVWLAPLCCKQPRLCGSSRECLET